MDLPVTTIVTTMVTHYDYGRDYINYKEMSTCCFKRKCESNQWSICRSRAFLCFMQHQPMNCQCHCIHIINAFEIRHEVLPAISHLTTTELNSPKSVKLLFIDIGILTFGICFVLAILAMIFLPMIFVEQILNEEDVIVDSISNENNDSIISNDHLNGKTEKELKEMCKQNGLFYRGSKEDCIERLKNPNDPKHQTAAKKRKRNRNNRNQR
eukprot:633468_1